MKVDSAIQISDLTVRYGEKVVLDHFNAQIPFGRTVGLMGPSGCGKTTLLLTLMGLLKPSSGAISGSELESVSVVFQENRLCDQLTVMRNVLLPVDDTTHNRSKAKYLLKSVGLDPEIYEQKVRELSGGMKRRVSIVRALMVPALVYLMDEPVKELDEANRDSVIHCISEQTKGNTLLFTTHDPDDLKRFEADMLIRMK